MASPERRRPGVPKAKIDLFDNKERTRERGRWTMTKRRACTSRLGCCCPISREGTRERERGGERESKEAREGKARQGKAKQGEARQASREPSDPTKVGCYLTILVKRSRHYTIGLDPESRSVTDRERCQPSHSDCLHRRERERSFASFRSSKTRIPRWVDTRLTRARTSSILEKGLEFSPRDPALLKAKRRLCRFTA